MATKILIVGGTGYIGKFIVEASAKLGHPTFVLVREATLTSPAKSQLIDSFKSLGVSFVQVRTLEIFVVSILCFRKRVYYKNLNTRRG